MSDTVDDDVREAPIAAAVVLADEAVTAFELDDPEVGAARRTAYARAS